MIVVTGANGFIGKALTGNFAGKDAGVRALSRNPGELDIPDSEPLVKRARLPDPEEPANAFETALQGATCILHCAALNSDAAASEADFMKANGLLTRRLAEAAPKGCRFIYFSSIRAVAPPDWSGLIGAATSPSPRGAYAKSKLVGEQAITDIYGERREGGVILRLPMVYGVPLKGFLGRLFALAQTPLPLPAGNIPMRFPVLSLASLVRAAEMLVMEPAMQSGIVLAADSAPVTLDGTIAAFRKGMGRSAGTFAMPSFALSMAGAFAGPMLRADQDCDTSGLQRLGWSPDRNTYEAFAAIAAARN